MDRPISSDLNAVEEAKRAYDNVCKTLLSYKIILAWIMHSCLEEYKNIPPKEIAEKYIEGDPQIGEVKVLPNQTNQTIQGLANEDTSINEGEVYYDIRFLAYAPNGNDKIKLIINVEAQNKYYLSYPLIKRGIYYLSRMISSQYGKEFEKSHYEDIKKVYSIWICAAPPKNRENTITRYRLREENLIGEVHEDEQNYDLMNATMICLGDKAGEGILKLLKVLLASEENMAQRKQTMTEEFGIEMTYEMEEEVEKMCNLSQGVFDRGLQKGIQQGRQEGVQEGMQKGMQQGTLAAIQNLIESLNLTFDQAVAALKIPKTDIETYRKLLNA